MNPSAINNQQMHALSRWYLDRGLTRPTPQKKRPQEAAPAVVPQVCLVAYMGPLNSEESSLLEKMLGAISLKQEDYFAIDLNTKAGIDLLTNIRLKETSTSHLSGIVFGKIAARKILGEHYDGSEPAISSWFNSPELPWISWMHTWHPSELIENPSLKRQTWNDLQVLQKKIRPE